MTSPFTIEATKTETLEGNTGTTKITFKVTRADSTGDQSFGAKIHSSAGDEEVRFAGNNVFQKRIDFDAGISTTYVTVFVKTDKVVEVDQLINLTLHDYNARSMTPFGAEIAEGFAIVRDDDVGDRTKLTDAAKDNFGDELRRLSEDGTLSKEEAEALKETFKGYGFDKDLKDRIERQEKRLEEIAKKKAEVDAKNKPAEETKKPEPKQEEDEREDPEYDPRDDDDDGTILLSAPAPEDAFSGASEDGFDFVKTSDIAPENNDASDVMADLAVAAFVKMDAAPMDAKTDMLELMVESDTLSFVSEFADFG